MPIIHYTDASEAPIDEILNLFLEIDRNARGNTYDESTVSMIDFLPVLKDEDSSVGNPNQTLTAISPQL
jgi:hypothetical protein